MKTTTETRPQKFDESPAAVQNKHVTIKAGYRSLNSGEASNQASWVSSRNPMQTPELIKPSPSAPTRKSSTFVAVFNLIASIVGGGVLSLPYAFSQAGYGLGLVLLAASWVATDFSLYILCSCTRRTGTSSYIEVARMAFGGVGGWCTTAILLAMTLFVLVAYMVLVRDIWSGLVEMVMALTADDDVQIQSDGSSYQVESAEAYTLSKSESNYVLLVCLVVVLPACLAKSLHALRHMCYVGFFSCLLLTLSVGYRSLQKNLADVTLREHAMVSTDQFSNVLHVFPIISLAYMCQFNILSVHAGLVNPTRDRMKLIIHGSLFAATCIYATIGLCGYFYAYDLTKDDILLNFAPSDAVMVWGRLGLGVTLLVCVPMLVLPCRDAFNELMSQAYTSARDAAQGRLSSMNSSMYLLDDVESSEPTALGVSSNYSSLRGRGSSDVSSVIPQENPVKEVKKSLPPAAAGVMSPGGSLTYSTFGSVVRHIATTLGLIIFSLYFAISIPGVAMVWSVCGSSLGFLVAYGMPALFYLKIRAHKPWNIRKFVAKMMICITLVAMVACTNDAIKHIRAGSR